MDATAGFICYKRQVLETINLDRIKFIGYAFQIEMKYRAFAKKFKYCRSSSHFYR
jgi:dolichol-phosphate mannosyltransferase